LKRHKIKHIGSKKFIHTIINTRYCHTHAKTRIINNYKYMQTYKEHAVAAFSVRYFSRMDSNAL